MDGAKYRRILDENLLESAMNLKLGRRFTFQQDRAGKTRDVFKKIRKITGKFRSEIGALKSTTAKYLIEETQMKVTMEGQCTPKLEKN